MPGVLLALPDVVALLPPIFHQSQSSTANHRKNVVALHKLHVQCAAVSQTLAGGKGIKLTGEKTFNDAFASMIDRVLEIKRGVVQADRVIKFVAGFVAFLSEKGSATQEGEEPAEEEDDTPASRFIAFILLHVLKGFEAKDKSVRFRCVQLVALMISSLGELDEDLFTTLRAALLDRVRDKEPFVRVQAVIALSKVQAGEQADDLEEGEQSVQDVLLDVLRFDPAAEVRRAALLNTLPSPLTLPHLLARTRDTDTTLRRLAYTASLSAVPNPKVMSIAQREEAIRNGLGDREEGVRRAAGRMVGNWVEEDNLIEFAQTLDVVSSAVAEDALLSVFVTRPELLEAVELDDAFWSDLTPEKAFLARVFVDHCISTKDADRLESSLPVVTALAFRIQAAYNSLLELSLVADVGGHARDRSNDDALQERAFILGELCKLAVNLDYADEIGRRKMFGLVRDMLSQPSLPEALIARCMDVMRKLSDSERDLIRVVVEIVGDLRYGEEMEGDETRAGSEDMSVISRRRSRSVSVRPGAGRKAQKTREEEELELERAALIDVRCISLCIAMLERVNSTLTDNSAFHGLLPELIVPAVRSKDPALREQGLSCIGLCSLIDRNTARESFGLFMNQVSTAQDPLKSKALRIIFDMLMVHGTDFLTADGENRTSQFLLHVLGSESSEVQAVACEGIAKLMLSGMVSDDNILQSLVLMYLSPETADNQPLRQCLSYFFPVYCYSAPANQRRMQRIFIPVLAVLTKVHKELEPDQDMITPSQVGLLLVDWTDPQKAVEIEGQKADDSVHLDVAIALVKALLEVTEKEERKTLCQLLGKLHMPEAAEDDKIKRLGLLLSSVRTRRPLKDAASKNAVVRFQTALNKRYAEQLAGFDEEEYRNLEYLKEIFEFIEDIIPEEDEEDEVATPKPRAKRSTRTARNVVSADPEEEQDTLDRDISKMLDSDEEADAGAEIEEPSTEGGHAAGEDDEEDEVDSLLGSDSE